MQKKKLTEYQAYLFDADGTLMDTTELICRTYIRIVKRYSDRTISRELIIRDIGKPLITTLEQYLPGKSHSQMEQIFREYVAYQFAIAGDYLQIFPGVRKALQGLEAAGKQLAVVTSRRRQSLLPYLDILKINRYFRIFITPEATAKHKPDPEPVFLALQQLKARAADSLFIGDSVFDMQCAAAAGVDTCFVYWSHTPVESLPFAPDHIIDNMSELLV